MADVTLGTTEVGIEAVREEAQKVARCLKVIPGMDANYLPPQILPDHLQKLLRPGELELLEQGVIKDVPVSQRDFVQMQDIVQAHKRGELPVETTEKGGKKIKIVNVRFQGDMATSIPVELRRIVKLSNGVVRALENVPGTKPGEVLQSLKEYQEYRDKFNQERASQPDFLKRGPRQA